MKYNTLGNSDIKVSEICLGTMTFGEQNTEADGHKQMDYAVDNGVTFFDTAELYAVPSTEDNNGKTEDIIGTWFKKSGKRDQVILGTKVTGPSSDLRYISGNLGFSKKRIHEAVERSLKRLKTDYIDLYHLHWPERKNNRFGQRGFNSNLKDDWTYNIPDVLDTLDGLVQEGKIRTYGLSNETPWGVMRFLIEADAKGLSRPVCIQNPYNLLNRLYEVGLSEVSLRENIGLLAYSPMGFGLLSGKFHKGLDTPENRRNKYDSVERYDGLQCYEATSKYLKIAEKHNISLAQMSLAFVSQQTFVTSTIIGATSMDQLIENIGSSKLVLSKEILLEIEAVQETIPNPAP